MTTEAQPIAGMQGLDATFAQRLEAMIRASGGRLRIESGFRSDATQAGLYANAVKKYGAAGASKWVAPPGHSNHNKGLAVDLAGDIALAHKLAPQFGLVFPMSWEPWHIEPPWARSGASPSAYTDPPPGAQHPQSPGAQSDLTTQLGYLSGALSSGLLTPSPTGLDTNGAPGLSAPSPTGGTTPTEGVAGGATSAIGGTNSTTAQFAGTGPSQVQSTGDRVQWATDFLHALGKPVTPANLTAFVAWQQAESGGGGGANNPLNTTQGGYAGETDLNSVGVKNYATYADGIAASVKVINNGRYQAILDALDAGNDPTAVARAVSETPWGTGSGVLNVLGANPTLIQPTPKPAPQGVLDTTPHPPAPISAPGPSRKV